MNAICTQARAPKGGTTGVNGDFYEGGKFLPNTQHPRQDCSKQRRQWSGKVEIEPYIWIQYIGTLAENERAMSIWKRFGTSYGDFGRPIRNGEGRIVDWEWTADTCPHGFCPPYIFRHIDRPYLLNLFNMLRAAWIEGKRIAIVEYGVGTILRFE